MVFLVLCFLLFTIFFSSKLWLPSDVKIQNTAVGSKRNVSGNLTLVLDSWQYNRAKHYMEASFTIGGEDDTTDYKFVPVAHTNVNRLTTLDVSVAYCSNDLLTIQFHYVPESWQVISLWIRSQDVIEEDKLETASSESSDDTLSGANFLCDSREVVVNNNLEPQSDMNYFLQSIYNQIKEIKIDITSLNNKIGLANTQIAQLQFDISSLKANQKYQTKDDVQKSNSSIESKNSQVGNLKNLIVGYKSQIKNDQDKLKKLNQKMDDTKSGKLSPALDSSSKICANSASAPSKPAEKNQSESVTVD